MSYELKHKIHRDYIGEIEELKQSFCDDIIEEISDSDRYVKEFEGAYIPSSYGLLYDAVIIKDNELAFVTLDMSGDFDREDSQDKLSIFEIAEIAENIEDIVADNSNKSFEREDDIIEDDYSEEDSLY